MKRIAASFLSFPLSAYALWLCSGCASQKASLTVMEREAIYARAGQSFEKAELLKPRDEIASTNLAFALAPLFLQEVIGADSNAGPRVVFFETGEVIINGQTRKQLAYLWAVTPPKKKSKFRTHWQGIRTTLDSFGQPVLWEVLNDSTGARIVFVTKSVEADSQKYSGLALAGRRFAVETAPAESPDTVVARVIEDGPMAMGPILNLEAATGDVLTLICRCMTAQVEQVVATEYYDLRPLGESRLQHSGFGRLPPVGQRVRLSTGF